MSATQNSKIMNLSAQILSAYFSSNKVPPSSISDLIGSVHESLAVLLQGSREAAPVILTPAVNPKRSVNDDYIICLEDGKKFKSLKRHLATHFGMTPEQYRQKWNLPASYPMVSPNYAASRSKLAVSMGLGRKPGTKLVPKKKPVAKGARSTASA